MIDRKSLKVRVNIGLGLGKALNKKLGKPGAKFAKSGIGARKVKAPSRPSRPRGKG